MKIGIDASRLAVGQRTGTENYAYQVIRGLVQAKEHQFTLYCNQPLSPAVLTQLNLGSQIEVRNIPFPRLWTHLRLSREMLQHPPNCLFVPAHVLPLIHPSRSVVTVHDLGYLYFPQAHSANARRYLALSTRFSAHSASRVIAISRATASDLMRHCAVPASKIEVIYHGYDAQHYQPITDSAIRQAARIRYGIGSGRFLLYVGTIQPRKNLLRLLDAFASLASDKASADVQLVLGGKGGWLSEPIIERAKQLQGQYPERIILPGYIADADLPALLSDATAFVFPSLYEGFGMPVLEAMACGCPVICSNSSSLPEVAGDAALYHHPLDTVALETGLRRLLSNPKLADEMRQKGIVQASRFSWERCAEQTLQVIKY